MAAAELKGLAVQRFGRLSQAEEKLLDSVSPGTKALCGPSTEDQGPLNDPAQAEKWGDERVVRAELIRWLCSERQPSSQVDGRGLTLCGARIIGKLDLSYANVPFPVSFQRCRLMDDVDLTSVKIPELSFLVSQTRNLLFENAEIKGNLAIKATNVEGEVRLLAAQIGSTLNCRASTFSNPVRNNCEPGPDEGCGKALRGDRMRVTGGVLLRDGFTANGEVLLNGAIIGGDLSLLSAKLNNLTGDALSAEHASVGGNLFLTNIVALGTVDLDSAKIEGHLNCIGGTFDKVILNAAVVKKTLLWSQVKKTNGLDLRNASVGALADNEESWPERGYLHLDGFQYERFTRLPVENSFGEEVSEETVKEWEKNYVKTSDTTADAGKRISWIARDIEVNPQPYRELAKVLRDMGDDDGAREVLLEMERRTRALQRQRLPMFQRLRDAGIDSLEDTTIGYGLYPLHAIYGLGVVCFVGWIIHRRARNIGAIAPTDKSAYEEFHKTGKAPKSYSPFSPLTYALENSVPFLKLGLDSRWEADANPNTMQAMSISKTKVRGFVARWNRMLDVVATSPKRLRLLRRAITTVRLNVEENQLVNVFGEFCVCVGCLKSA